MTELAIQILNQPFSQVEIFRFAADKQRAKTVGLVPSKEIIILGVILIFIQFLDGIFTAYGVHAFGNSAEGNPIIRSLMNAIGHIQALVIVKSIAIMIVGYLCLVSNQISWIAGAMPQSS